MYLTDQICLDAIVAKHFVLFYLRVPKLGLLSLSSPSLDFSVLKFLHFSFLGLLNHCLNQNPGFYLFLFLY